MKSFLIAIQFLTSIPTRVRGRISDRELARSMFHFPLVGVILGGALCIVYLITNLFLPHLVICLLLIVSEVLLTKALHLDGLADTIDGLSAGKNKEGVLSIMRQGEIGAFGAIGLVTIMLAKLTLLYSLKTPSIFGALILMATYGRWSLVASAYFWPYAREGEGTGKPFVDLVGRRELVGATIILMSFSVILAKWATLLLLPISVATLACFNGFLKRKIGGVTGDTLGAGCELIEVIALIALVGIKG